MENGIASLAEIEQIEATPIAERLVADNTYDLIRHGVSLDPRAPALSFFADGNTYKEAITYSYADFLGEVNRTANMFHDLGIGPGDVVSYLLPNLPQTHFVLWGGQAAGIVNPINPMLNAEVIQDICEHAKTKVLVALGSQPGSDIWEKVESIRDDLPDLKAIVRVMGPSDEAAGIYGYEETVAGYAADKIGERAAVPKEAFILEQMPLTAVGKIFKPKLRWLAIENAYRKALTEIAKRVDSLKVSVGENSVYGSLATITGNLPTGVDRAEIKQLIADKLGPFMTRYELKLGA